jgi:hypothetical protein
MVTRVCEAALSRPGSGFVSDDRTRVAGFALPPNLALLLTGLARIAALLAALAGRIL